MKSAKWDITSYCNLRCSHCSVADLYFSGSRPLSLSIRDRLAILDRLADGGITHLSLLGGEPLLLREELLVLLARARERGMSVSVVTNATLLTRDTATRLIDAGLAGIVVSIESPDPLVHDGIRGRGSFRRTVRNLESLIALRGSQPSPRVAANTVLSRPTRATFAGMVRFCCDHGIDAWNALSLNFVGNAADNLGDLSLPEEEQTAVALEIGQELGGTKASEAQLAVNLMIIYPLVWEYLRERYEVPLPEPEICCTATTNLAYITPQGDMHLCDRVYTSGYSGKQIGAATLEGVSLLERDFLDVWGSAQYHEMFSLIENAETYAKYYPCNRCKYLADGTCKPCPLMSLRGEPVVFHECAKAARYLGDNARHQRRERTEWERRHDLVRLTERQPKSQVSLAFDGVRDCVATRISGARHAERASGRVVLVHPVSGEEVEVNGLGNAIWETIDGTQTMEELVEGTIEATRRGVTGLGLRGHLDETAIASTKSFFLELVNRGFLQLENGASYLSAR